VGNTSYLVSEGVPTWLGGTTGMDLRAAARALAGFLTEHPGLTLDSIMAGRLPAAQYYPAAGVFVAMVHDQGGTEAVKALFSNGGGAEFRAAMEHLFKRSWGQIAADWRRRVLSAATEPGR
jgi:hypothetical protein